MWYCPNCSSGFKSGDYPDHWMEMTNNQFVFECECGCKFTVNVEFEPIFYDGEIISNPNPLIGEKETPLEDCPVCYGAGRQVTCIACDSTGYAQPEWRN